MPIYLRYYSSSQTAAEGGDMPAQCDANGNLKVTLAGGVEASGIATEAKQDTQITAEQSSATSLAIIDDWDESDRAKVNLIVGQVGVAGGAGAVGATSQRVVAAGLEYETVAAGQTAQALGATGATGDFLSHVILQPVTTAAGTTTILDNATVIFTYTTGTLADLRPIVVPINAISVSGAWKITTGANMTATGFGDFT